MDEYLRDLRYFADKFSNTPGYGKAKALLKSTAVKTKLEPEAFVIRVLRSEQITNLAGLEVAKTSANGACEPDVVLADNTICEFKSWTGSGNTDEDAEEDDAGGVSSSITCFDRLVAGQGSYQQFVRMLSLQEVASINKLRYYFDARKITAADKLKFVKQKFVDMLKNPTLAGQVFGANPSLFRSQEINIQSDLILNQKAIDGSLLASPFLNFIFIK